jgi:hypothetical protein
LPTAHSPDEHATDVDADTPQAAATLRVDLSAKELTGVLVASDGGPVKFSGWMELASALEDWRHAAAAASDSGRDT